MKIEWKLCYFETSQEFVRAFKFDFPMGEEKYAVLKMIDTKHDNREVISFGQIVRYANCYNVIIDGHFGYDFDGWRKIVGYCFLEA